MSKKSDKPQKIRENPKQSKKKSKKSKKNSMEKTQIIYICLLLLDIILIIFFAKNNYANFVSIANSKNTYIGNSFRNLIFGKNYITLLTSMFFFVYTLLINKFILHRKNSYKFIILLLLLIITLNCTLFYIFTNKIY